MESLISMTDFVLEQNATAKENYLKIFNYAIFLKQKHELWMFVPCKLVDGVWVVIPDKENHFTRKELEEYQEAKERCLFDGFEVYKYSKGLEIIYNKEKDIQVFAKQNENEFRLCSMHSTIEDLVKYKPKLTASVLKQILL